MLMKLTPSVNVINVLRAAFMHADPKSIKRYLQLNLIFMLLGSARVKALRNMLMELTSGLNFINILQQLLHT